MRTNEGKDYFPLFDFFKDFLLALTRAARIVFTSDQLPTLKSEHKHTHKHAHTYTHTPHTHHTRTHTDTLTRLNRYGTRIRHDDK